MSDLDLVPVEPAIRMDPQQQVLAIAAEQGLVYRIPRTGPAELSARSSVEPVHRAVLIEAEDHLPVLTEADGGDSRGRSGKLPEQPSGRDLPQAGLAELTTSSQSCSVR